MLTSLCLALGNLHVKGHFVPEFFLRRFRAPEGNLWVYFHGEGWKRRGSSDTASEVDFYSPELEQAYQKIETAAANILDKTVYRQEAPEGEQREILAYFLALLQLRTPTYFSCLEKPLSEMMHMVTSNYHQYYSSNPEAFQELKRELAEEGTPLPEWFGPEHLHQGPFKISPTKDLVFGTGIDAAQTSAEILNRMTWQFLTTSPDLPFITSDSPFVRAHVNEGQPRLGSLLDGDTQVFVPLSSTVSFVAEWPTGHQNVFLPIDEAFVRQVNLRVMAYSDRFIVASTQAFPGANELSRMRRG